MKKRTKYFKTSKQVVLGKKFSGVNFFFLPAATKTEDLPWFKI